MTVLVLFATVEGQTEKIADFVIQEAESAGFEVQGVDLSDERAVVDYGGATHVVLAAPVHERRHPQAFETALTADRDRLAACRTLLLSVSLNAAFAEGIAEAEDYVVEMKMRTGFAPDREMLVAGAVRAGEYDYFASQIVQHVVLRDHPQAIGQGTQEFTDWAALRRVLAEFLAPVSEPVSAS